MKQDHYLRMMQGFAWHVPRHFNMAHECAGRWAVRTDAALRVAIIEHGLLGEHRYSYAQLQQAADRVSALLKSRGVKRGDRVALVLQAEPSRRAYVRRVNVAGNSRTRDEIIRREMRQMESAWYDGDRIRLSRDRIERLGYFKEVTVDTQEVPGAPDQVDLVINVAEKPTGSLQLGAGYSSFEKLFLTFGIQQDNIFGSGN